MTMETYKFETTILENGVIKIPEFNRFQNRKVRISIETITSHKKELEEKKKILKNFFDAWGGFFPNSEDADDDRYNYLMEKYK